MIVNYFTLEDVLKLKIIELNVGKTINDINYIVYDPLLDKDNEIEINSENEKKYCDIRIIRSVKHDGTLIFTYELLGNTYLPLINMTVNDARLPEKIPVKYIIGKCRIETHDIKEINSHDIYMNTLQITSIPVKFIY